MRPLTLAVLFVGIAGALLPWLPFLQEGEDRTIDARFQLRGPLPEGHRVVVVAIDDATEKAWRPIPKAMWGGELAKLVAKLNEAGAKRIGLDFVISADPDNYLASKGIDEQPNAALDQAIIESGERVLLGTGRAGDVVPPLDLPDRLASVNRASARADVVRQVPRHDPTFSPPLRGLAAALADEPSDRTDPVQINYTGRQPSPLSARDVIEGRIPPDLLRGAIVIAGETYEGTADLHPTPYGWSVPGVLVHAEAVRTLLDRNELQVWPLWSASIVTLLASLLGGFLAARIMIGGFCLIAGGVALTWSAVCLGAFSRLHAVFPWFAPMIALLLVAPTVVYAVRTLEEHRERLYVRARWGQLVGESTLRRLEENRKAGRGAWETFECGLLFLDVADFSRLTRRTAPRETIELLNRLFVAVIERIEQSGGEVINFMGDGLSAKWELGELGEADPHQRVLDAALEILAGIDRLNSSGALSPDGLRVRIGLSSGETTLALIGSENRQQMTLYGEAVNLAARLEAVGKEPDIQSRLVVSERYAEAARACGRRFESGRKLLKGWDAPTEFLFLVESPPD
ncbi:MAG TPA: adenylate/guanylate cyclase domain-containing protein [Fimbriimonadaceae bacterium]|nr:adenylate/guanylate cyclase domain-containing protein [Fimbriimonadaceae bacterium]